MPPLNIGAARRFKMCLCNGYGCSNCEPWFYDNDAAQEEHGTGGTDKQLSKSEMPPMSKEEFNIEAALSDI